MQMKLQLVYNFLVKFLKKLDILKNPFNVTSNVVFVPI